MSITAFVFPGQGSQSVGMLCELAKRYPLIKESFTDVSTRLGYDLWHIVQNGPVDILNQTEYTQVAMLTADVALYRVLQLRQQIQPKMLAGHSLGEYAALVCAQALDLPDAAELVARRGKLMQEAVPIGHGSMAAIVGLPDEKVVSICALTSRPNDVVTPANYNALGQVVIAGNSDAVLRAMKMAEADGAKMAVLIPVSVPCHCPLLQDAAIEFAHYLQTAPFKTPTIPVISNVDLSIFKTVTQIRTLLQAQLYSPVRWVETIQYMHREGIERIIECGPGKVLSGLVKRIDRNITILHVDSFLE